MNRAVARPRRDFAIDYDLMDYINDTISAEIENAVQESVDYELAMMVTGEGFKKRIQDIVDARLQSLVSEMAIKTSGAGPGRGHKGRTHRKISLSLPEPLYMKVKELDGFFSCHVASALELYLQVQEKG
jgi:hypothetical protein